MQLLPQHNKEFLKAKFEIMQQFKTCGGNIAVGKILEKDPTLLHLAVEYYKFTIATETSMDYAHIILVH